MKLIDIEELLPGDVLAENVYTPKGQLIGMANRAVSAQLILHMKYYNVSLVKIHERPKPTEDEKEIFEAALDSEVEPDGFIEKTLGYKLRISGELHTFAKCYSKGINSLKDNLNDLISKQGHIRQQQLLEEVKELFYVHPNSLGIMSMLLSMREIDDVTYAHSVNVALISRALGGWLGFNEEDLDVLTLCGLLHDLGKALIPNEILTKQAKLTNEEFEKIKQHPSLGYELIRDEKVDSRIKDAVLRHHERGNGTGYPDRLTSSNLSAFTEIVTIADVYDAMTADRSYRRGMSPFDAMSQMMKDHSGYNTDFLYVFLEHVSSSFIGVGVELNDGTKAIVQICGVTDFTRPVVCTEDYKLIDLKQHPELSIKSICK